MRKNITLLCLLMLVLVLESSGQSSLKFNGTNSYVSLGNDAALHLQSFTLEAWVKVEGTGIAASSGTGGLNAVPVIAKGRGEADAPSNLNMNYFLGIDANRKLTADFEEASGPNHPVVSKATIPNAVWTHVAVTYEPVSAVLKLYINGVRDTIKDLGSNKIPADVSIQPAAIGSALNSTNAPAGFFNGEIDEARIWNVARTDSDIARNYRSELTSGTGLVARYGMNENGGTVAANSITTASNGTLVNNPLWTTGYSFSGIAPPPGFVTTNVSTGWNQATGLTFNSTGSQMFVWEKAGKVWVVENNVKKLLIDISPEVGNYRDFGLLSFALSPQFETNGYFYLFYSVDRHHLLNYGTSSYSPTKDEYYNATIHRLTRYTAVRTATGYTVDTLTRKVLIGTTKKNGIPAVYSNHGPGTLLFGTDGTLLLNAGDGASSSSVDTGNASETYYAQALADTIITPAQNVGAYRAQLLQSYDGKILRIDPETGYGVPGNPFYDAANPDSVRSKVWALGIRNAFRMTLKPGTGSTNPADGNPGTIYMGDVGYNTWEELDVVNKPGINFGWPIFEGLTPHPSYSIKKIYNYYAPNPLYGTGGCTQKYFYFTDLIKQATASGTASFNNPCNTSQRIPSTVNTFIHTRPIIDWHHTSGPSRTGTFNSSGAATVINIGAAGSPVSGPQFMGDCGIGGVFYTHNDFPPAYQNTYIFGDYVNKWIRNITTDVNDMPKAVSNAIDSGTAMVAFAVNPAQNGLYYINYTPTASAIKKITYNQPNQPPVAVAASDKKFGASPVTVNFTGTGSIDPEGHTLSYVWNFGDGTSSTEANPSHTFTSSGSAPVNDTVILTVQDGAGGKDSASIIISVNNTPPQVTITNPVNNTLYPTTHDTTYNLQANVADVEEPDNGKLSYQWQTIMHHHEHEHPEPIDTNRITTTQLSTVGCDELYYYRILLTVTDPQGLATTREVRVYPTCSQRVTSYTLVSAVAPYQDIKTLNNGDTLNLATLPTKSLNIRANTNPPTVGSVELVLSGAQTKDQIETNAPYALFSDNGGNYYSWTPAVGNYYLQSYPYSAAKATGNVGTGLNAGFTVINKTPPVTMINLKHGKELTYVNDKSFVYYPNLFDHRYTLPVQKKSGNRALITEK